ncbi:MAG: hypothetical protein ACRDZN_15390 [Acidimicrobiales bacterium]
MPAHRVFGDGTMADTVGHFVRTGWVHVRPPDGDALAARLRAWADEVATWPDGGGWLHYRELTETGPALCRTENLVPHHDGLRSLLCSGSLVDLAGALLGERCARPALAGRRRRVHPSRRRGVDDVGASTGARR